jgi:hypothetical protein
MKTFNARLTDADLKRLARKARRLGLSQTALLREWINAADAPTVADGTAWQKRNEGNPRLWIDRV